MDFDKKTFDHEEDFEETFQILDHLLISLAVDKGIAFQFISFNYFNCTTTPFRSSPPTLLKSHFGMGVLL